MRLTARDKEILWKLQCCKWLTTSQIQRTFFPDASLDPVRKRMRKLVDAKYLQSYQRHHMTEMLHGLGKPPKQVEHLIGINKCRARAIIPMRPNFSTMKTRGLTGKKLECITTDGGPGCIAALKTIYPFKKHQRCIAHKLRNMSSKLKMNIKGACMAGASAIFAAQSRTEAIRKFNAWKRNGRCSQKVRSRAWRRIYTNA